MIKQYNTYEYQQIRGIERKLHLVNLRGGCCEKCGYKENLSALDFHHIDPMEKESNLDSRHLSNRTMEWILKEFAKCKVLCSNCHREEHNPDTTFLKLNNRVSEFKNALKIPQGKPKCIDCGIEINYTSERCTPCKNISTRKHIRPSVEQLQLDINELGYAGTGRKYNIAPQTIRKWIK